MDLAKFAEQDMADVDVSITAFPSKESSLIKEDYVTWQASQRCEVLSRFMVSTENHFNSPSGSQGMLCIIGSQNDIFIPAIEGSLSCLDKSRTLSSQSDNVHASLSKNIKRPLFTSRTSEGNIEFPAKSTTSELNPSIPFFDEKNPARFLALLKGVSARVDENAGVRNHDLTGPSGVINDFAKLKRKRPQMNGVAHSLAAKRVRSSTLENGKSGENACDVLESPSLKSQSLQTYQSLPDIASEERISRRGQEVNELPQVGPTFSQNVREPCPTNESDNTRSGDLKLHPLLRKAAPRTSSMTSTHSRVAVSMNFSNPVNDDPGKTLSPVSPTSSHTSTPVFAAKYSGRPPALGMRRTRTMPSQLYGLQNRTIPDVRPREKIFRPPLLSDRSQQPSKVKPHVSGPSQHT